MAIASDNTSASTVATTSDLTWTHTVNSNTNGKLIVGFAYTLSSNTITSVTYNGSAMTAITGSPLAVLSSFHIALYYIDSPTVGANTVEIITSLAGTIEGGGLSLTGTASGAPEANNTATGSGVGNVGGSVTTVSSNAWVIDVFGANSSTPTYTPANTAYYNLSDTTNSRMSGGQSQGPIATPASTSSLWNISGVTSRTWGQILISIAPSGGGPTTAVKAQAGPYGWSYPI